MGTATRFSGEAVRLSNSSKLPNRVRLHFSDPVDNGRGKQYWPSDDLQKHRSPSFEGAGVDWSGKLDHWFSTRTVRAFCRGNRPASGVDFGRTFRHHPSPFY